MTAKEKGLLSLLLLVSAILLLYPLSRNYSELKAEASRYSNTSSEIQKTLSSLEMQMVGFILLFLVVLGTIWLPTKEGKPREEIEEEILEEIKEDEELEKRSSKKRK